MTDIDRRRLLKFGLAAGAAAGIGVTGRAKAAEGEFILPERASGLGRPVLNPPYGQPSPFEKNVIRRTWTKGPLEQGSSMTPLADLHGIVTPNGLHFERHHSGVPELDPDHHRLVLHGLVRQPLSFSLNDLLRFPSVSRIWVMECSGNGNSEWAKPTRDSVQGTHGLMSCCEWTGVPLATLLDEAGLLPGAQWVLAEGADSAAMTRSVPLAKALDDALVAYAQNGEALRPEQGYPIRLFLPGFEGNMNVKWLRRLKVAEQPFYGREETAKYTDLLPNGKARIFSFEMDVKSVITRPSAGHLLKEHGFREIVGLAWSGRGRISRVEVSTDGGASWQPARLQEPVLDKCLTRFTFPWVWQGEPAILQSRAVDDTGEVQPSRAQLVAAVGVNSYYHYNAIQSWKVAPGGEVTNVHA